LWQDCVSGIVAAFYDGRAIIDRIKANRAKSHAPQPPRVLDESVDQALEEIVRAKDKVISQDGKDFQDGDHIGIIALQQVTIQLQSSLLQVLRDAINEADAGMDFTELVAVADGCRDNAIGILADMSKRLSQADSPLDDTNGYRTTARPSLQDRPVLKSSQESSPVRGPPPTHLRTWTRQYSTSGDEDTGSGADDTVHQSRRHRHSSLFGFLKHHRSHSGSNESRPEDLRRASGNPTSAPNTTSQPLDIRANSSFGTSNEQDQPKFTYQEGESSLSQSWTLAQRSPVPRRDTLSVPPDAFPPPLSSSPTRYPPPTASPVSPRGLGSTSIPNPNPENDYLGFCKSAWRLQTGDRKAMQKCKEFNDGWSHSSVYFLGCSNSKCAYAGHIDLDVIWTKIWTAKDNGIKFRWPFLAKSHVTQSKVKEHQYVYQCLFCIFLGNEAPVMHGTDLYLEHIAQEHRGRLMSDVVLHKTECVNDRICDDSESFDVNLFPLTLEEEVALRRRKQSEVLSDELLVGSAKRDLDAHVQDTIFANEPWNQGLSEFHVGGELERTERE
jgi:hypothetical protein